MSIENHLLEHLIRREQLNESVPDMAYCCGYEIRHNGECFDTYLYFINDDRILKVNGMVPLEALSIGAQEGTDHR